MSGGCDKPYKLMFLGSMLGNSLEGNRLSIWRCYNEFLIMFGNIGTGVYGGHGTLVVLYGIRCFLSQGVGNELLFLGRGNCSDSNLTRVLGGCLIPCKTPPTCFVDQNKISFTRTVHTRV